MKIDPEIELILRDLMERMPNNKKSEIAENLIDIMVKEATITEQTREFIGNWILTGPNGKGKSFYDIWDIVLKNYIPNTRPILFRACNRISKKCGIASFTGKLESANNFNKGRGYLIICDTKEQIDLEQKYCMAGEYTHTFYPLASVLRKAKDSGGWGFSDMILNDYIDEDEYIMRMDLDNIYWFKTMKHLNPD